MNLVLGYTPTISFTLGRAFKKYRIKKFNVCSLHLIRDLLLSYLYENTANMGSRVTFIINANQSIWKRVLEFFTKNLVKVAMRMDKAFDNLFMFLYNKNVLEYVQIVRSELKSMIRDIEGFSNVF